MAAVILDNDKRKRTVVLLSGRLSFATTVFISRAQRDLLGDEESPNRVDLRSAHGGGATRAHVQVYGEGGVGVDNPLNTPLVGVAFPAFTRNY